MAISCLVKKMQAKQVKVFCGKEKNVYPIDLECCYNDENTLTMYMLDSSSLVGAWLLSYAMNLTMLIVLGLDHICQSSSSGPHISHPAWIEFAPL